MPSRGFTHGARATLSGNSALIFGGRGLITETTEGRLWADIKNLVLAHKLFPAEGYEFPQEQVAGFWKEVFRDRGITVFGSTEVPSGVKVIQTDFELPDEPPKWLFCADDD